MKRARSAVLRALGRLTLCAQAQAIQLPCMRTFIAAGSIAIALACTPDAPPAPDGRAIEADTQAILAPEPPSSMDRGSIAGFVTARDDKTLSLDSGGAHLIPLRVTSRTPATLDGRAGTAVEIREGDVVRASYQMGEDGAPRALAIVAESKPVTGIATPASVVTPTPQKR
jgi:hypothetical protein